MAESGWKRLNTVGNCEKHMKTVETGPKLLKNIKKWLRTPKPKRLADGRRPSEKNCMQLHNNTQHTTDINRNLEIEN